MKFKQLTDLNRRFIVSFVAVCLIAFLIIFSAMPLMNFLVTLIIAALAGVGVWEYAKLAIAKGLEPASHWMVGVAIAFVFSFFISLKCAACSLLPLGVLALGMISFFIYHFKYSSKALVHIALEFFAICYIAVPLSFLLGVLYLGTSEMQLQQGKWWLAYLIIVTKITDIGAYFVGRLWGKHPLAPILSPKKTVEGAIAGFFCAVILSILFYVFRETFVSPDLSLIEALILGTLIGIFSQVGDLAESLLKRDAFVKDSNTLPGLGGVLDTVDSLLFTTPIVYLFIKMH